MNQEDKTLSNESDVATDQQKPWKTPRLKTLDIPTRTLNGSTMVMAEATMSRDPS